MVQTRCVGATMPRRKSLKMSDIGLVESGALKTRQRAVTESAKPAKDTGAFLSFAALLKLIPSLLEHNIRYS